MTLLIRQIALVALLLILAVPAWGQEEKGVGVVTALTGKADLKRPQAPEAPLKLRDNLFVRDVVDTQKESLARILLMGKSSVTVRELSRLELREETRPDGARRVIIDLAEGKIRVMVARRLMKPGDEVQIRTPNAIAAVRGSDGIIEATTLPDGRPQTSVLVASGVFEVTTPSTRPIAMAETMSDVPSGMRLAQAAGPSVLGAGNLWVAIGRRGLQQAFTRFAPPNEVNAAIRPFTVPIVARGAASFGRLLPPPAPPGKKNFGQVVSQYVLSGGNVMQGGIFTVVDFINNSCARGACSQGIGLGSTCAHGACKGGPPGGPPGGGPPCGTPPCGGKPTGAGT